MRFIVERSWLLKAQALDLDDLRRKVERSQG